MKQHTDISSVTPWRSKHECGSVYTSDWEREARRQRRPGWGVAPAYYVRRPLGGKGAQPCTIRMQSLAGRASSNTADISHHGPHVRRNPRKRLGTEAEPHSLHLLGKKRLRGAERSQYGGGIHHMSGGACHHTSHISAFRGGGLRPVRKARTRRGESCTSNLFKYICTLQSCGKFIQT